jgi:succinyl-diaminopimelate desuccinylase
MIATPDPLDLSRDLIRCPSITPADAGALDVLQAALESLGFTCHSLRFTAPGTAPVDNLYARIGEAPPNFCFAGHTDVVPPGDVADWTVDPFAAEIRDGRLIGRGASDMKTAIACFVAAVGRFLQAGTLNGSISLLITGDEEGPAINGTVKVLDWLADRGERLDACLVGEPTCPTALGEVVKIGRRGSLNGRLRVDGVQGHAAYPQRADNPIPRLIRMLAAIDGAWLDDGTEHFEPSRVTITSVDVGNPVTNVIPARAVARFNVRFNDRHTGSDVHRRLEDRLASVDPRFILETECSGEPFLSPPGRLTAAIVDAVSAVTGLNPALETGGGTSDARFIRAVCPVAEFGMPGETAHKVDENVAVADLERLTEVYRRVLELWFASVDR